MWWELTNNASILDLRLCCIKTSKCILKESVRNRESRMRCLKGPKGSLRKNRHSSTSLTASIPGPMPSSYREGPEKYQHACSYQKLPSQSGSKTFNKTSPFPQELQLQLDQWFRNTESFLMQCFWEVQGEPINYRHSWRELGISIWQHLLLLFMMA